MRKKYTYNCQQMITDFFETTSAIFWNSNSWWLIVCTVFYLNFIAITWTDCRNQKSIFPVLYSFLQPSVHIYIQIYIQTHYIIKYFGYKQHILIVYYIPLIIWISFSISRHSAFMDNPMGMRNEKSNMTLENSSTLKK